MEKNAKRPKRIRSLDRGLAVLEHLSKQGQSTLADLRKATGLGNATLLRILATMQDRNWVRRALVEGKYQLTHSVGAILRSQARANPVAELAAPIMAELARSHLDWPSDFVVPVAAGLLEVVESTRARGPLAPTRTAYGVRPSIVFSAHGRALLAHSPQAEVDTHLAAIRDHGAREEKIWLESGQLAREIEKTRRAGYGIREKDYWAKPFDYGPELGAIAYPILIGGYVHATLSMLWPLEQTTLERLTANGHIDALMKAAGQIGREAWKARLPAPKFAGTGL